MTAPPGTAARMIEVMTSYLGYTESPPGSNCNRFSRALGRPCEYWCDDGISEVAIEAGCGAAVGNYSYTPSHAASFQAGVNGRSVVPISAAVPGDILFCGETESRIHHVTLAVAAWDGSGILNRGCNTSPGSEGSQDRGGCVAEHHYLPAGPGRFGIKLVGRPAYQATFLTPLTEAQKAIIWRATTARTATWGATTLSPSSKGAMAHRRTRQVQQLLHAFEPGLYPTEASRDGNYDRRLINHVHHFQQAWNAFHPHARIGHVDGLVRRRTIRALLYTALTKGR